MEHKVKVTMTVPELSKVPTKYEVVKDGRKLGELHISKGGIDYYPPKRKKSIHKSWTQLHDLLVCSVALLITGTFLGCGKPKKTYNYQISIPKEITDMKARIDTLESFNLPGMQLEIQTMKRNISIAEFNHLDTYYMKMQSEWIDENGKPMTKEDLADFKSQIKYDSLKAALEQQMK